jgi:hypothetical protein
VALYSEHPKNIINSGIKGSEKMEVELDHPTLTHMLGYLTVAKWADAIRQKSVNVDLAYAFLKIQDERYHGNMVDEVKQIVALSKEDYRDWLDTQK